MLVLEIQTAALLGSLIEVSRRNIVGVIDFDAGLQPAEAGLLIPLLQFAIVAPH